MLDVICGISLYLESLNIFAYYGEISKEKVKFGYKLIWKEILIERRGYSWKCLLSSLIAMQVVTIKALAQWLQPEPMFKRSLGFDYLGRTSIEATLNRFINLLAGTDILEKITAE